MMTNTQLRLDQFDSYATHAMLGKRYAEVVRAKEIEWVYGFVSAHDNQSIDGFAEKVVRISIMPNRPKAWLAIEELLLCTCSSLRAR